ncbi:GbsR/MarR family transcriptional regulator [Rubrobacter aplysinae]|uniref:GbsR/MarR family transcriptional regulator n=1 Tax=Rubrobacter aplysinae TaxID=909625 RepID=UPI00069F4391|nr:MarR family transcriptional regulator [Rubrobacter aplysinae]
MDEERASYVEDFGMMFEGFGLQRMVGRSLGALLVSEEPELSAEELAEALQASRGSISSATKTLTQMGLVQRYTRRGERRDYFRVKPGAWDEFMRREMESLKALREMAERGLAIVDSDEDETREKLEDMHDFFVHLEREFPEIIDRWQEEKGKEQTWSR